MTKPRKIQGTPDQRKQAVERKPPPANPPKDRAVPEDRLAAASTTRDPTIINRTT